MAPLDSPYRRVPGILLLLVGLGIALFFGISWHEDFGQEKYEYEMDGDVYVYEFADLSASERTIVRAALNGTEQTTSEPLERFNRTDERFPTYLVSNNGSYYKVETRVTDTGDLSVDIPYQYERDIVHEYPSLSAKAQRAVQKAAANSGEEVTVQGALPPEFETGSDAPSLNHGRYYIRYDGEYYHLSVDTANPTGIGAGFLRYWYLFAGSVGLVVATVGFASAATNRICTPTATLVAFGVFLGLHGLAGASRLLTLVTGFAAALVTWNLLYWYDTDKNRLSSPN